MNLAALDECCKITIVQAAEKNGEMRGTKKIQGRGVFEHT
jgi:hypothetical protein